MHLSSVLLLLVLALFLVLTFHVEDVTSIYAYAIRGLVTDIRNNPFRFVGGLFFKKAFILKKLKLKWKLKKKFVLKKLLKKLFLGWKLGLTPSAKSVLPKIFAQYWSYYNRPSYYQVGDDTRTHFPPIFYHQHHHRHHFIPVDDPQLLTDSRAGSVFYRPGTGALLGRKRRAVRFPGEGENSSNPLGSTSFPGPINPSHQQISSSSSSSSSSRQSSRMFFDDDSISEFQSIGLGEHELELLRQLPENLQHEYRQEMQELETSASEPREAEIMEYLTATNEFDTDHCIAKGICEVMARGNKTSNQFENLLLEYYNEEPEARKDPNGAPAYIYDYAAFLGKSTRNGRACANYFPKCPEPTQRLTGFMNEIFSSEMCDPPVTNELRR